MKDRVRIVWLLLLLARVAVADSTVLPTSPMPAAPAGPCGPCAPVGPVGPVVREIAAPGGQYSGWVLWPLSNATQTWVPGAGVDRSSPTGLAQPVTPVPNSWGTRRVARPWLSGSLLDTTRPR